MPTPQKPPIDLIPARNTATASFSMGCFWSPDALFGAEEGVLRTSVGYAGGTSPNPSYRNMGNHIETIRLEYDPDIISYQDLLNIFFNNHKPIAEAWKRQYMSAIFYQDEKQKELIDRAIMDKSAQLNRKLFTAVYPYQHFYLAEERHQKYKLQRQAELMDEFKEMYPCFSDFLNSTAAARVNAYLYGYGSDEDLNTHINQLGLSPAGIRRLFEQRKSPQGGHFSR